MLEWPLSDEISLDDLRAANQALIAVARESVK